MRIKDIQHKHCESCLLWQIGQCGGAMYWQVYSKEPCEKVKKLMEEK
jgi:hypothetical protein